MAVVAVMAQVVVPAERAVVVVVVAPEDCCRVTMLGLYTQLLLLCISMNSYVAAIKYMLTGRGWTLDS